MDLAEGHVAALKYVEQTAKPRSGYGKYSVFNLGTGHGTSVLEMVEAMSKAAGKPLPYEFGPRRGGDVAQSYADPSLAKKELGWEATRGLEDMCRGKW